MFRAHEKPDVLIDLMDVLVIRRRRNTALYRGRSSYAAVYESRHFPRTCKTRYPVDISEVHVSMLLFCEACSIISGLMTALEVASVQTQRSRDTCVGSAERAKVQLSRNVYWEDL